MKLHSAALVVLFTLAVGSPRSAAQVILNGDFESPIIPPGSFNQFDVIPGWTPTFGFVEIQSNFFLGPGSGTPSGNQYCELNAAGQSTIRTSAFSTSPGQEYIVSYLFAARPSGPTTQTIGVAFTGTPEVTDFRVNGGVVDFTPTSFTFTATGGLSTLTLRAISAGDMGNLIDSVSVTAVPEPTSLLLGACGIFGGALASRLRTKRRASNPRR